MKILMIDNYDSFTYNLVAMLKVNQAEVDVRRNDKLDANAVSGFDGVIISPGPGVPDDAGQLMDFIKKYTGVLPMLGVCLGHQAIGMSVGVQLTNMDKVFHGVEETITIAEPEQGLFKGISQEMRIGRYHSWTIDPSTLPSEVNILAMTMNNDIMAIHLPEKHLYGVQFHPESIMTEKGQLIINNFLEICRK